MGKLNSSNKSYSARLKSVASLAAALSLSLSLSSASHAALVSQSDASWGVDSITLDDITGLQWLDLNLSTNISYNAMLTEQGSGGLYDGFRYATASEVETLFNDAGVPDVNSSTLANTAPALALINIMGATRNFRGAIEIFGITGTTTESGVTSGIVDHSYNGGVAFYDVNVVTGPVYGLDYSDASIGNWLVADSVAQVPLPASWLFFSAALGMLGWCKRKINR